MLLNIFGINRNAFYKLKCSRRDTVMLRGLAQFPSVFFISHSANQISNFSEFLVLVSWFSLCLRGPVTRVLKEGLLNMHISTEAKKK